MDNEQLRLLKALKSGTHLNTEELKKLDEVIKRLYFENKLRQGGK